MLKFKDLLKNDARAIMSAVEFAEYLWLNGVLLACQFVPYTNKFSNRDDNKEGLHGDFATLYFKTQDYTAKSTQPIPKQGDWVYLQGGDFKKRYRVESSADDLGVTCLQLAILRQNFK